MSKLFVSKLKLFLILSVLTAVIGVLTNHALNENLQLTLAGEVYRYGPDWLVGSCIVWGMEIFWVQGRYGSRIRRLHFLLAIAVKSIITILLTIAISIISKLIFEGAFDLQFFIETPFLRAMATILIILILLHAVLQVIRIVGGRALINFVLGKYVRPVREEKFFMFLDMAGSTALAEKLGDEGVQTMITMFFFDITEPIVEFGGEVHRYVGDQVVVTWPLKTSEANASAVECSFAISDRINELVDKYRAEFGEVPGYRIGLHGGPVVISQIGDQKQEISYFGDTVNTAARIEQQCKTLGCNLLISGELLDCVSLPTNYQSALMGTTQLRGREGETELYSIIRTK